MPQLSPQFFQAVTDFGDSAVLTVAAVCAIAMLLALGNPKTAWRFSVTFGTAGVLIGLLKIWLIGCGNAYSHALHLTSPSGHTALTTAFWGAVSMYIQSGRSRSRTRALVWLGSVALVASVATTRIVLGYHTVVEIAVGFLVGVLAIVIAQFSTPRPERQTRADIKAMSAVLAGIVCVMVLTHGRHFPAERIVRACAALLPEYVHACRA